MKEASGSPPVPSTSPHSDSTRTYLDETLEHMTARFALVREDLRRLDAMILEFERLLDEGWFR